MEVNKKSMPGAVQDGKDTAGCVLDDWTSQHAQGQKLYRERRFEDALRCFTLAIKACPDASLIVRDNRAATYIKAGDLNAAMRDGRKMIQEAEHNCIGYLRTGKILQLMGQQDLAMKIYKLGLDKTPHNVDDRKLLQVMHSRLVKKLAPPQRIDPLRALPLELTKMMLWYLDFKEVVYLRRVSKTWQQLVDTMPYLWSDLDFTRARKPICLGTVRKYIDRSKGKVTRVNLDRFTAFDEKIACYIASHCKELQELRIPAGRVDHSILKAALCASNLKTLIVTTPCQTKSDEVMQLLSLCPNLETAEFSSVIAHRGWRIDPWIKSTLPNLRSLMLGTSDERPERIDDELRLLIPLNELIRHMPNLRKLSLPQWALMRAPGSRVQFAALQILEALMIPDGLIIAPAGPFLPSSLQHLDMGNCVIGLGSSIEWNAPPTKLVWLSIAGMMSLPFDEFIKWLEPNRGNLSYLDASERPDYRHHWAELGELGYLNKVEELNLNASEVNDETVIALSTNLPVLKILHLKHTKVTGVGLKVLVTNLQGTLKCLYLDGCLKMGLDAVRWARNMGIKVSFKFVNDGKRRGLIRSGY